MEQAITSFEAELAELDKKTDEQITFEANFFANQHFVSGIEFGKRLIVMKKRKQHGEWLNWLSDNFNLSYTVATRFMQIAERFSNVATSQHFTQSQMIEMLSLPAGDTEKFIEQKAAEGKPVESMTVKTLREEIQQFKRDNEALANENNRLQSVCKENVNRADKAESKLQSLFADFEQVKAENAVLKNQKPITVEPNDYQQLKKAKVQLQNKIDALHKELQNKTVEVVTPADYDATKKELARLQAEQSEIVQRMEVFQKLDSIALLIQDVMTSQSENGVEEYAKLKPDRFSLLCGNFADFLDFYDNDRRENNG